MAFPRRKRQGVLLVPATVVTCERLAKIEMHGCNYQPPREVVSRQLTYLPDVLVSDAVSKKRQTRGTYKCCSLCVRGWSCVECASFSCLEQSDGHRLDLLMRMLELRGYICKREVLIVSYQRLGDSSVHGIDSTQGRIDRFDNAGHKS